MKSKTLLLTMTLAMTAGLTKAQEPARLTITPRAGMNISILTGGKYASDFYTPKVGWTIGADGEYRINEMMGVTVGAFLSDWGAKRYSIDFVGKNSMAVSNTIQPVDDHLVTYVQTIGKNVEPNVNPAEYQYTSVARNPFVHLYTLSVPVMFQVHVIGGLSVKLGVENDLLLSGKERVKVQVRAAGETTNNKESHSVTREYNRYSLSVPVGVSYRYKQFELDARYVYGVTNVTTVMLPSNNGLEKQGLKNSVLMLTLGYHFDL